MAKKKEAAVPGTAVATAKKTSMVDIYAELKKESANIKAKIGSPGGDMIRTTQDKHFILPNGTKDNKPLRVVILDFVSLNQFFDRPYKKGEESPAACFALSAETKGMVPSPNSPDKQADACDICPNNEYGSNGAGKACGNTRLLAIVEDSADPEAPIRLLKVSATAIKGFDAYVNTIHAQFELPPVGVVTEIYFDPTVTYASLRFGNPSPNENLAVHYERRAAALKRLLTEPDVSQYKPPVAAGKAAKKR